MRARSANKTREENRRKLEKELEEKERKFEKNRIEILENEKLHSKRAGRNLRLRQALDNVKCSELYEDLSTKLTTAEEVYAWTSDDLSKLGVSFFKRRKVLNKIKCLRGKSI